MRAEHSQYKIYIEKEMAKMKKELTHGLLTTYIFDDSGLSMTE